MGLDEKSLDTSEYRNLLKETIATTVVSYPLPYFFITCNYKLTSMTLKQLLKEGNLVKETPPTASTSKKSKKASPKEKETPKAKDEKVDKKSKKVKVEEKPKSKVNKEKSTNIKSKVSVISYEMVMN